MTKMWTRVTGPDLDEKKAEREKKNKNVFESDNFKKMCEDSKTECTKRQASKYNNKRGRVYMFSKNLL